jgi:hypothetical protein
MKTYTIKNQNSVALNRPEQSGTANQINFKRRFANRSLKTENLLTLLRSEAPKFFELAEVVGKWVWIQFDGKQPAYVTRALSEFGFHWNNKRQTWQHPCGIFEPYAPHPKDPRRKYGSYFAADVQAA